MDISLKPTIAGFRDGFQFSVQQPNSAAGTWKYQHIPSTDTRWYILYDSWQLTAKPLNTSKFPMLLILLLESIGFSRD